MCINQFSEQRQEKIHSFKSVVPLSVHICFAIAQYCMAVGARESTCSAACLKYTTKQKCDAQKLGETFSLNEYQNTSKLLYQH